MKTAIQIEAQTATLETADPTKNLILVPLSQLVSRPSGRNVRKGTGQSIGALAASIARVGLLQNLTVIQSRNGEHYAVVGVKTVGKETPHPQNAGNSVPVGRRCNRPHRQLDGKRPA